MFHILVVFIIIIIYHWFIQERNKWIFLNESLNNLINWFVQKHKDDDMRNQIIIKIFLFNNSNACHYYSWLNILFILMFWSVMLKAKSHNCKMNFVTGSDIFWTSKQQTLNFWCKKLNAQKVLLGNPFFSFLIYLSTELSKITLAGVSYGHHIPASCLCDTYCFSSSCWNQQAEQIKLISLDLTMLYSTVC